MPKRKKKKSSRKQPARIIITRSPHQMVGAIHQPGIMPYPAEWESHNERKLYCLLLLCSDVTSIEAQPRMITYMTDKGERSYTPDMEINVDNRPFLVEVKSLKQLIKPKNLEKYLRIAECLRRQRQNLEFITDDQMPTTRVRNARLLRRYRRIEVDDAFRNRVLAALPTPKTVEDVVSSSDHGAELSKLYALIASGHLCIDWDQPLNRQARVSCPNQPFRRLNYEAIRTAGRFADLVAEMALGRRPSDQRLLAASLAHRRPLSANDPFGFVAGLTPAQLGHYQRQVSRLAAQHATSPPAKTGAST